MHVFFWSTRPGRDLATSRAAIPDALASGGHAFAWPWQCAHHCLTALAVGADAFALACDGSDVFSRFCVLRFLLIRFPQHRLLLGSVA